MRKPRCRLGTFESGLAIRQATATLPVVSYGAGGRTFDANSENLCCRKLQMRQQLSGLSGVADSEDSEDETAQCGLRSDSISSQRISRIWWLAPARNILPLSSPDGSLWVPESGLLLARWSE